MDLLGNDDENAPFFDPMEADITFENSFERMERMLDDSTSEPVDTKAPRSIATYPYPGDLLICIRSANEVPAEFDQTKLWCNSLTLELENSLYLENFRMIKSSFLALLGVVSPCFDRSDATASTNPRFRKHSHRDILALTLRFLGHCDSMRTLQMLTGIPHNTISSLLIPSGLLALEKALFQGDSVLGKQIKFPENDREKERVIEGFKEFVGGMPQCLGAIDGTLITMKKPTEKQVPEDRDSYWSFKHKIAMLLLGIVDARGAFLYINVGAPGSAGDAGVWNRSILKRTLDSTNFMDTPALVLTTRSGKSQNVKPFFVGDGAFSHQVSMQKCFEGDNHAQGSLKWCWNRAVCDHRKVVEQAFGRLKMRFKFCHHNNSWNNPEIVRRGVMVCCCLHNYLQSIRDMGTYDDVVLEEAIQGRVRSVASLNSMIDESASSTRMFLGEYMMEVMGYI